MAAAPRVIPPETLALYERLVATIPEIKRKGATIPYTSVNGHMFSMLNKDGSVGLRLPAAERDEFLKRHKATLLEQYGIVMKEYVQVPPDVLKNTRALAKYFACS